MKIEICSTGLRRGLATSLTVAMLLSSMLVGVLPAEANALWMKAISFHSVEATTQLVLDLTAAPLDLEVYDEPGKPMTISFRGRIAGKDKKKLQKFSFPNLSHVYYEEREGKIQIFINRKQPGTVAIDATPDHRRMTIKIPHYYYDLSSEQTVSQGVRHMRFTEKSAAGPIAINVLEVDPSFPGIEVMPSLASNQMGRKASVSSHVRDTKAIAGINGSFFKQDKGIPLGILIINQELVTGPIFDRVALGITNDNQLLMDRVRIGGEITLPNGQTLKLDNINQPRIEAGQTVVYSNRWGSMAPGVPSGGLQVQMQNNRVTAVSRTDALHIPKNGLVVSGPSSPALEQLAALAPMNAQVGVRIYTLPDWSNVKQAISGGPYLVKSGKIFIDTAAQRFTSSSLGYREPRTAVGVTPEGRMLLVTVDGRQKRSVGMTLGELAYLMKKLGAVNAMNLDGGSSTQMAIHGRLINSPSAGQVPVANALLIRHVNEDGLASQRQPLNR